jgi:hypothetical protein
MCTRVLRLLRVPVCVTDLTLLTKREKSFDSLKMLFYIPRCYLVPNRNTSDRGQRRSLSWGYGSLCKAVGEVRFHHD